MSRWISYPSPPIAPRAGRSWPMCRRLAGAGAAQCAGQRRWPELRRQPDLFPHRGAGEPALPGTAAARCRWAGWCRRARMRCSRPTCAARQRTASSARCSRCVAAGWGARRGLTPVRYTDARLGRDPFLGDRQPVRRHTAERERHRVAGLVDAARPPLLTAQSAHGRGPRCLQSCAILVRRIKTR